MPLNFSIKTTQEPNLCHECHEQIRRPKHFCDSRCESLFHSGEGFIINKRGAEQVAEQRRRAGITPEAMEWKRRLNVSRAF
jgi:hypothetical protein